MLERLSEFKWQLWSQIFTEILTKLVKDQKSIFEFFVEANLQS
jgi:hypothetical protein